MECFKAYLIPAMRNAYLTRIPKYALLDEHGNELTPIDQVVGGYQRTSVHCLKCDQESVTVQRFEDLILDISNVNILEGVLDSYFKAVRMGGRESYKCESCKTYRHRTIFVG